MAMMKISDIKVTDRARKELGDIEELAKSIEKRGLINPICVERSSGELIAGFRRLAACQLLEFDEIEVKYYEDLDPIEKKLLELEENLHKEFTWDEQAQLRVEIHNLHCELKGKKVRGRKTDGWGIEDTAELLNVSPATISQDMALVEGMSYIKDLKKLTSRNQALKALDRFQEMAVLEEIARREREYQEAVENLDAGSDVDTDSDISQIIPAPMPYRIFCGDAVEVLKEKVDDETISLVIFDPPWGIDIDAYKGGISAFKAQYRDDWHYAFGLIFKILEELYRVMQDDTHMYFFCSPTDFSLWRDVLTGDFDYLTSLELLFPNSTKSLPKIEVPWKFHVQSTPLIWLKDGGAFTNTDYNFMSRTEIILFCSKGVGRRLREPSLNVFDIKRTPTTERRHPQEKPVELMQRLIKLSTVENEIVLDPCAGSFSTALAATLLGRRSVSIEKDEKYFGIGVERLKFGG